MDVLSRSGAEEATTSSTVVFRHAWLLVLLSLLVSGFGVRLFHANQPPLHFHPTRQYRSLLIARAYYLERASSVPEWQRSVAQISRESQGLLEPPIMEYLVATGYHIVGGERFWVPRAVGAFFWVVGGVFLFLIAERVAGGAAAVLSTAFYLFAPFAVVASTSFQPEPLMVALLLIAVYAIIRYYDAPSNVRMLTAAGISALAFFVKPITLFPILGVFLALAVGMLGLRRTLRCWQCYQFVIVSLLPLALFYGYTMMAGGLIRTQAQASFIPGLVLTPFFWRGWLGNIDLVLGLPYLLVGFVGLLLIRDRFAWLVAIGLWAGYVALCLVFSYHIATHDYYHLVLIPIIALSVGPLGTLILQHILSPGSPWYARAALPAIAILALVLAVGKAERRLWTPDAHHKMRTAVEIGEHVKHSTNTVYLSADYGLPLEYHGRLSGRAWPLTSDLEWERLADLSVRSAEERFGAWFAPGAPDYFIVADMREFEAQDDLKQFLFANFPLLVQESQYLVFDLRSE